MIKVLHHHNPIASFIKDNRNFIIDYNDFDIKNSISLSLPNTKKIYLYDYKFSPFLKSDAHLKNFGLLFDDDFKNIFYSPVYDVINTVVYIHKDKPALMLEGKKIWYSKDTLIKFGQKSCLLTLSESKKYYQECFDAVIWAINRLQEYLLQNLDFKTGKILYMLN